MPEVQNKPQRKSDPKKGASEEPRVVEQEGVVPEPPIEPPAEKKDIFVPKVYVTRAKRGFLPVVDKNGNERIFNFNNNGKCGVYKAVTQEEVDLIESSPHFGKYHFLIVDEDKIPSGSNKKVVVGARSALNGQVPSNMPRDAAVELMIAEAQRDTSAMRPVQ
jgi:hypothetical protein